MTCHRHLSGTIPNFAICSGGHQSARRAQKEHISPWLRRAAALAIISALANNSVLVLSSIFDSDDVSNSTYDSALASALVSALALASNSTSALISTSGFVGNSTSALAGAIVSALVKAAAKESSPGLTSISSLISSLAHNSALALTHEGELSDVFERLQFTHLAHQLEQMSENIPSDGAPSKAWQDWANNLEALWLDTLGLDRTALTFTPKESEALKYYLYATELLIHCKNAAVRIPKQAWADLEDRLLTV